MRAPWSSLIFSAMLLGACLPTVAPFDAGPILLGTPCDPFLIVDACNSKGYVCTTDGGSSCQYPEFDDPCLVSVGCDPDAGGLTCIQFSADGGPEALETSCGTFCYEATDCPHSTDVCDQAYLPDGGSIGGCQTNFCQDQFAPCFVGYRRDGGAAPPGTCIPIGKFDSLVCNQSGPIPTNGACSGAPIDGGAYLCQANDLCTFGPSRETACTPICGGGLTCPANTTCVPSYQLCLTPCSSANLACDSPYTCQNLLGLNGRSLGQFCTLP